MKKINNKFTKEKILIFTSRLIVCAVIIFRFFYYDMGPNEVYLTSDPISYLNWLLSGLYANAIVVLILFLTIFHQVRQGLKELEFISPEKKIKFRLISVFWLSYLGFANLLSLWFVLFKNTNEFNMDFYDYFSFSLVIPIVIVIRTDILIFIKNRKINRVPSNK